jgi:hypothetical protein
MFRGQLESLSLIEPGMTQKEVEAILVVPPGDYTSGPRRFFPSGGLTPRTELWVGAEFALYVGFDASGRVANKGKALSMSFQWRRTVGPITPFLQESAIGWGCNTIHDTPRFAVTTEGRNDLDVRGLCKLRGW